MVPGEPAGHVEPRFGNQLASSLPGRSGTGPEFDVAIGQELHSISGLGEAFPSEPWQRRVTCISFSSMKICRSLESYCNVHKYILKLILNLDLSDAS